MYDRLNYFRFSDYTDSEVDQFSFIFSSYLEEICLVLSWLQVGRCAGFMTKKTSTCRVNIGIYSTQILRV